MRTAAWAAAATILLAACADGGTDEPRAGEPQAAGDGEAVALADAQREWWDRVQALCGQAFGARMTHYDPELDEGWLDREVIMHVRECEPDEIRIPLHVGENRSRTWVLTRTDAGIRLEHDHRHRDGTEETMSQYGGHTTHAGTASRQEFPASEYSRELFLANDHPDGVHNVWVMEIHPGERFSYALTRPNRHFQADFDLTRPVEAPPPPWVIRPEPGD